MTNSWSEQILVEEECEKTVNGKEEVFTQRVLKVCLEGQELFRKEFVGDKYKGKNELIVPFDFIAVAGSTCPHGKFYEMEYFIGEPLGTVYRGLIQAVDPVTDLRLIVGALQNEGKLPKDLFPRKAWLLNDIEAVCIGNCTDEHEQDEKGMPLFFSCHKMPTEVGEKPQSVLDRVLKYPESGVCIEFYQGTCQEVWICGTDKFQTPDIFVCGSVNVNDPAFAEMRKQDLEEMTEHLDEALSLAIEYNLGYVLMLENRKEDGTSNVQVFSNLESEGIRKLSDAIGKGIDAEHDAQE